MVGAFGLGQGAPLRGLVELACRPPASRFARQMLQLDALVGAEGLRAGGAWICGQLSDGVTVSGGQLPATGPLLIVANHPGLLDAAALFSAIPRSDLRVMAITRPFLKALPNIAGHLFPVGATPATRMAALRLAARHLRGGGALLSFPAGRIEPDPVTIGGATAALRDWSQSVDLLARLAGDVTVVPAIVGGVITRAALQHPLVRMRRRPEDRHWLAAILQLMRPELQRGRVRVAFGRQLSPQGQPVSERVAGEAGRLIAQLARP